MARNLTAAMITAITDGRVVPFIMAAITTNTGTVRVWNGAGTLTSSIEGSSNDYNGVGHFGGVSAIGESMDLVANGMTLSLSGIPSSLISAALDDIRQGSSARVWFGLFDNSNGAVIADPYEIFTGVTDVPSIDEGGETSTIQIVCENKLASLRRIKVRRYTKEDQRRDYPNDKGFDFVQSIQDREILWGQSR